MSEHKYTHIQVLEREILALREAGATRQGLGLSKTQIKSWINRHNRKQGKSAAGILPPPKGRPRKGDVSRDIVAEQAYEIRQLRMEN